MKRNSISYSVFALTIIAGLVVSATVPRPAAASPSAQADGVRYGYSDATGALTFVGADPSQPVAVAGVSGVSAMSAEDQALGIIDQYADALGLSNPSQELRLEKAESFDNRTMLRYQQVYGGIPVMGGDLILNTQGEGYLLSLSGEVSPELSLDTGAQLTAEQASAIALQAMQKWYPDEQATFQTSEPELWIYDPRLLEDRDGPIVLGWRMDVTSDGISLPIRELVLVDAKTGNVPLHFNQIDTGWNDQMQEPAPTEPPVVTETPLPTEEPTLEPTATEVPTETAVATDTPLPTEIPTEASAEPEDVGALVATPRYVATTGTDSGTCTNSASPCLTINYAIGQAVDGDTIDVASGTYTGTGGQVVYLDKSLEILGGWNLTFAAQTGTSIIDGSNTRQGIYFYGWGNKTAAFERFVVTDGKSPSWGGNIFNLQGTLELRTVTVSNGRAEGEGGGIYNNGTLSLVNSAVSGNSAPGAGGGIANYGSLTLTNVTISQNGAMAGGGIYSFSSTMASLNNTTISDNNATWGGGIASDGTTLLENSLLGGNSATNGPDCYGYGEISSSGHNLIENTAGCDVIPAGGDQFNVAPGLATFLPVQGYHPLRSTSLAIDAGKPATCLPADQRGVARVGTCDIGAYEYTTPGPATMLSIVSGSGQHAAPDLDFAEALEAAALDSQGSPVENVVITFTAPASGASGTFANTGTNATSAATNSAGVATTSIFTANGELGSYFVPATASGVPGSADFALANVLWFVATSGNDSNSCAIPAQPCLTINGAITKAWPGDTIRVASGTYTGSGTYGVVTIQKSITISGGWNSTFASQAGFSTIDGQQARRGFYLPDLLVAVTLDRLVIQNSSQEGIYNGGSLQLKNSSLIGNSGRGISNGGGALTLVNTTVSGNQDFSTGGGIYNQTGTVQISNSTVSGNTTTYSSSWGGGAIYNESGSLTLNNVTLSGNTAGYGGGAIHNASGTVTINNSTFSGNSANGQGGGIYNAGILTLNGSTLSENSSDFAGGAIVNVGTMTVSNSTLSENTATVGGGIRNQGGGNMTLSNASLIGNSGSVHAGAVLNEGTLSISNSTLSGNQAGDSGGGGIYNQGSLTLSRVTVSNNRTKTMGGGVFQSGGPLTITNSTLSGNLGETGGGLYLWDSTAELNNTTITQNAVTSADIYALGGGIYIADAASLTLSNSILAGNDADYDEDCSGAVNSGGHNLIGYGSGCSLSPASGDLIGTLGSPLDAHLGNLQDNGGPTFTHALLAGSPAINGGDPATCLASDQRGVARPQGAACDIGAFEGAVTQTVAGLVRTYTAGNQVVLPGTFLCNQTAPNCTAGANPHADKAHKYAIGTYNLYKNKHGRAGIDGNNMPVISTVHFDSGYGNAFWSGAQLVFGDAYGFPRADDVVAHELTHGVTEYESGLFYFYESGAISESLSDVWGEYYDQTNGQGNDSSTVKWKIGEDVSGLGAIRSMSDPTAYGDPDKMTSSLYNEKPYWNNNWDNGGVHSNSGVGNKAAFLMVQGGTFNGKTVTALGWNKTAAIYYEVQTHLLASGAGYGDLYNALYQACLNLADAGTNGITTPNCQEVRDATNAVQMNVEPSSGYNPDAALCPSGQSTGQGLTLFQDNFENGTANWTESGAGKWTLATGYASSPSLMMWGDDTSTNKDSRLVKKTGVALPAGSSYYLHFKHAYAFDYYGGYYFDGGRLEYTTNNGSTWLDAKPLFSAGANYRGTIATGFGNALQGKQAFVGDSHGYVSSRYSLQSLAGKTVKFRWRFATDQSYHYLGWFVDDVRIYRCVGTPSKPTLQSPANGALVTDYTPPLNWSDSTPNLDHYQLQVATNSTFTSLLYNQTSLAASQYTIPANLAAAQTLYWRVRAFNVLGQTKGWSSTFSFRTALPKPVLISPANGETVLTLKPVFDWGDVTGASGYTIQIATSSSFSSVLVTGNPVNSTFTPGTNLPAGATLYWRVRSTGSYGPSAWSAVRSFHTP